MDIYIYICGYPSLSSFVRHFSETRGVARQCGSILISGRPVMNAMKIYAEGISSTAALLSYSEFDLARDQPAHLSHLQNQISFQLWHPKASGRVRL